MRSSERIAESNRRTFRAARRARASVAACLATVALGGCGGPDGPASYGRRPLPAGDTAIGDPGSAGVSPVRTGAGNVRPDRFPWESWREGRDFSGRRIADPDITRGDRAFVLGDRDAALAAYSEAAPQADPEARRAHVYRVAALNLSGGRPRQALASLSKYFSAAGSTVDSLDPETALLLAWAYGRSGDTDQAFAWFSRAASSPAPDGRIEAEAAAGSEAVAALLPDRELAAAAERWAGDRLIGGSVAAESERRAAGGRATGPGVALPEPSGPTSLAPAPVSAPRPRIIVLLPLSGGYSALGAATRRGIELAASTGSGPEFEFRDSPADPDAAADDAVAAVTSGRPPSAVLGPLLSDTAGAVGGAVTALGVPVVHLSKRDPVRGDGAEFRLGITNRSQVRSLLASPAAAGISRVAVVAPDDAMGSRFADEFRSEAASRGISIVSDERYKKGVLDPFGAVAPVVEQSGAEAVFFPDNLTNAARFFSSLDGRTRARLRPLGTANWYDKAELLNSREALDGATFVAPFFAESSRKIVADFVAAYRAAYSENPDFLAAQGFDAATLLTGAASRTVPDLAAGLKAIDSYEGVTGTIGVRPDGEVSRSYAVVEFRDGALAELDRVPAGPERSRELPPTSTSGVSPEE